MAKRPSAAILSARAMAAAFDANRAALSAACQRDMESGLSLNAVAEKLNKQAIRTKTGKKWSGASVHHLLALPNPPLQPRSASPTPSTQGTVQKKVKRTLGVYKTNDKTLSWVASQYPQLEQWRFLASRWVTGREGGVGQAISGVNALLTFIATNKLPIEPAQFLLRGTRVPDFYQTVWGKKPRTQGNILCHNNAHFFLNWVLTLPEFTEEDDDGVVMTSSAFRNPVPHLSRSGLAYHVESVRSTLPYGYVSELRRMIAEGPHFRDWKWAQNALGASARSQVEIERTEEADPGVRPPDDMERVSSVWFETTLAVIDKNDPDCVWRQRTRLIPEGRHGMGRHRETIYEMWSPVRWVALLLKLQLPLRTFQVRMLDSGEADTWKWENGEWVLNDIPLALGTEAHPHSNGIFRKPRAALDGDVKVLLHINTNKTADAGKWGSAKGYNCPWIVGGPIDQDPFYWLEKLRRWQAKYNPLERLTKWAELDGRHIPPKSAVQLASYPDTAFLFRTPETVDHPYLPLAGTILDRPWFNLLSALERRLAARGETLPGGGAIRLVPRAEERKRKTDVTTLFSLHCLRVSLLTALALDGDVPLAILQRIAGHSRLIMTLYYVKPGAAQMREAIHAGVQKLNEGAGDSIVDWLANTEYTQLVNDVIANNIDAFQAAIPELTDMRSAAGWMVMVDGLCLVGGNATETEAPGCHNGGPNVGNESKPRHAPVPGGIRNCPRCRWFITRPYFLPQLAARWNNAMYHCTEAKEQVVLTDERFRNLEDIRADALAANEPFPRLAEYKEVERTREQALRKFDELTMNVAAITRLIERCRQALRKGDGTALVAGGTAADFEYAIEDVSSELLQLSGVSQGAELYPDLDPGKAVLRQSQLLDAALCRDRMQPVFLMLSEDEQKLVGNAFMRHLSTQMNPANPGLGRYQVISLIDAGVSLRERFGPAIEQHLALAAAEALPGRGLLSINALPSPG